MGFNLIDMVKDQVAGQLIEKATGMLGESESGISKALGGVFPTVLGSVIGKASEEGGASKVFDMVKGVDPGILGNFGDMLGGGNAADDNPLMSKGMSLLGGLMGDKLGGAVDMISKLGGIKSGSAMSLFKMATPLLTGALSKKVKDDGLGLDGFTSLLDDQKDIVSKMMPAGMGSLLGLGSMLGSAKNVLQGSMSKASEAAGSAANQAKNLANDVASKASAGASSAAATAKSGGSSLLKWLIPLILIVGAVYLLTQTSMCKDTAVGETIGDTMEKGAEGMSEMASETAELAKDAGGAIVDGAKAAGAAISKAFSNINEAGKTAMDQIQYAAGSAGDQLKNYIQGDMSEPQSFRFKNLTFDSGRASIYGDSGVEVDNFAAIMKAYPDVKILIEGHTDTDGEADANMALSEARANAVKARLVTNGIDGDRIMTKGYGESQPIADDATAEGKAQNRRIEIQIVE